MRPSALFLPTPPVDGAVPHSAQLVYNDVGLGADDVRREPQHRLSADGQLVLPIHVVPRGHRSQVQPAIHLDGERAEVRIEIAPAAPRVSPARLADRRRQPGPRCENSEIDLRHRLGTAGDIPKDAAKEFVVPRPRPGHGTRDVLGVAEALLDDGSRQAARPTGMRLPLDRLGDSLIDDDARQTSDELELRRATGAMNVDAFDTDPLRRMRHRDVDERGLESS